MLAPPAEAYVTSHRTQLYAKCLARPLTLGWNPGFKQVLCPSPASGSLSDTGYKVSLEPGPWPSPGQGALQL